MGKLVFYAMDNEYKEELFFKALIQSRLKETDITHVALNQLSNKKQFRALGRVNIDYYYNPNERPGVSILRLKEALGNGTSFIVRTNIAYLEQIEEIFKDIGFTCEYI